MSIKKYTTSYILYALIVSIIYFGLILTNVVSYKHCTASFCDNFSVAEKNFPTKDSTPLPDGDCTP